MGDLKKAEPQRQSESRLRCEQAFYGCLITCFASLPGAWIYPSTELCFQVSRLSPNSYQNHLLQATSAYHLTHRWNLRTRISQNKHLQLLQNTHRDCVVIYPSVSDEVQLVGLHTFILSARFSHISPLSFAAQLSSRR